MSEMKISQPRQIMPYAHIKDPMSALSHFIGFLLFILLTPVLLSKAGIFHDDLMTMTGSSIYCLSLIILYGASSAYHTFFLPEEKTRILKKIDHISIFLLIAGTYTPICLCLLKEKGLSLLIGIWTLALAGIIMKLFWIYCPRYVSSIVYISMGWLAILKIRDVCSVLPGPGFFWLLSGGLLYTIGGIIYALKIRISEHWTQHEVFHIFVLLGSICHFIMVFFCVI
ncbi:MAG: hemolysin III family protein [Erysipelotrichaceae bacterium]|nr:hemolysin III family protein [Erysipelotrichaceae bacterium]